MLATDQTILFFDGVCNLCNGAVQWLLLNDKRGELRFASLQSELATELLPSLGVDPGRLESLVLYRDGVVHQLSDAALGAGRALGGFWGGLSRVGALVPRVLRDPVYRLIARNRYRWFGKQEECMLPRAEWKARFLG